MKALFKRNIPNDNFVDMMTRILKVLITASALVLYGTVSLAQQSGNGQVEGVVTDAITGETLIGVNVLIEGTNIGSASNVDGEYRLRRVPAGTQTLIVSYIGYERIEETIEVEAGETLEFNAELTPSSVEGAEVVVSGQARGQKSAINEQISSRSIKNVVSADKIRELPDESAATALSRLPGVSLQDGDKVVVRGVQAKMNTVMVNGIQLPSTNLDDRSTNLGFISSNMLSGIDVTKAVTPDMDASSIGGVVNLRLQEAPEGFHADVLAQGDYNTQNDTYKNYQVWASVSNRFFDNKLGAFLQGNARRLDGGQHVGNAIYDRDGPGEDLGYGQATYGMQEYEFTDNINITEERGGSLILDYDLENGKLVMQNTYAYTNPDITSHLDRLLLSDGGRRFRVDRNVHSKHLIINALQGSHTVGDDLGLGVDYGLSHALSRQETDQMYGIEFTPSSAFDAFDRDSRLTATPDDVYSIDYYEGSLGNTANNGSKRSEEFSERQLVANLNLNLPVKISDHISGEFQTGGSVKQLYRENDVNRWFARLSEGNNNRDAREFLVNTVGMDNWNTALRFSDFRDRDYSRGENFLGGLYEMNDVVNTSWMDEYMRLAPSGWPRGDRENGNHIPDSERFDYNADERQTSAYIMGDFKFGSKIQVLGGLRYEHFLMDYDAIFAHQTHFDGSGTVIEEDEQIAEAGEVLSTSNRSMEHWFPNVQLQYNATDWFDVRLAYTKTLSRPDYTQLIPNIYVDNSGGGGAAGNPLLRPTVSQNFDAYFSFYNNTIGLFTVGAFYKQMNDIILQQNIQRRHLELYADNIVWPDLETDLPNVASQDRITTFINNECPEADWAPDSCPAVIQGLEFDWQTHFWYLPRPFDTMVLNVNYTRIFSEMDYRQIFNVPGPINPITGQQELAVSDTIRSARLLHQGDNIVNVALGVDHKGFSGRVSFRLQGNVISDVGDRPEEDAFTGDVYSWDFTIRQQLPVEGMSLFINGINITHAPTRNYQDFRQSLEGDVKRNESRVAYNPRRFQVGLRYGF